MAGAAGAVTDPPATLRARMIVDLANFVPAGTNVEAVADVLLDHGQPVRHGDAAGRNTKGRRKRLTRRKGKRK